MRLKKIQFYTFIPVFLFFLSCSSSIQKDAKKAAELSCEAKKMSEKVFEGEISMEESMELDNKATQFLIEMQKKYSSMDEYEKFMDAYNKRMEECE